MRERTQPIPRPDATDVTQRRRGRPGRLATSDASASSSRTSSTSTSDLRWSRELIDLLLDELHVSDEFDDLIGRVPPSAQVNYPQLVALALVLRHSWFPEDLARIIAELGLDRPPSSPRQSALASSEVIDTANRAASPALAPPSPHTCTPQKGEQRTC